MQIQQKDMQEMAMMITQGEMRPRKQRRASTRPTMATAHVTVTPVKPITMIECLTFSMGFTISSVALRM